MFKGRPHLLRGKILILVTVFMVITGLTHETTAETPSTPLRASSCSSIMVSTPLCDELITQSCIQSMKEEIPPAGAEPLWGGAQIQSSLIISSPKEPPLETNIETQPQTFIPTSSPIPTQTEPTPQITNLDSDRIFDLINQHRASQGLTPFELEASVCGLAQERATELAGELVNGTIHSGLYNRNLPYWIFENAKVGSNEDETVAWWLFSPLHHQSIVGDYKYSCAKCQGTNCTQLFTSFVAK